MKKPQIRYTFDAYFDHIHRYTDLLDKILNLKELNLLKKREIYEAYVIKILVAWEVFVKDLFVYCLKQDTSRYAQSRELKLPRKVSGDLAKSMISGMGYFGFKDTSDIKGIAKRILAPTYNVFNEIPEHDGRIIDMFVSMRNYIAHRSLIAKRSLEKKYRQVYHLGFRDPGKFLLTPVSGVGGKRIYFADYVDAFDNTAKKIEQKLFTLGNIRKG